jgi:hypothetical protein
MRHSTAAIVLVTASLLSFGSGALAGDKCSTPCEIATQTKSAACAPSKTISLSMQGKIRGRFDPAMSGVCRFACATRLKYDPKNVISQPGAQSGKLTQCPVSGVVFSVDASRPRVRIGKDDFVTCCAKCAVKLGRDPRHYLRV